MTQHASNIVLTQHAVERYIQRHAPGMAFAKAFAQFEQALPTAQKLRERATGRRGGFQWQLRDPDFVLITKVDPGDPRHICVTVLPGRSVEGFSDDELDILEEAERVRGRLAELRSERNRLLNDAEAIEIRATKQHRGRIGDVSGLAPVAAARHAAHAAGSAYELACKEATLIKEREKSIRFVHREAARELSMRDALRDALRAFARVAAGADPRAEIERATARIRRIDPGLLTEDFYTLRGRWPRWRIDPSRSFRPAMPPRGSPRCSRSTRAGTRPTTRPR